MPKAVQLSAYGGVDRLGIVDVAKPQPEAGEIVVRVVAAGTNPGEISIREGLFKDVFPMEFPFGQGTDFAGRIDSIGADVTGLAPGDDVLGWTDRRAGQAEYVASSPSRLIPKPPALDWFRAGSLFVVATTAVAAVRAVSLKPGAVVAISGAAGGVGSLAVQIARRAGARVIGIASDENAPFLRSVGIEPVAYGEGLAERLQALTPKGPDAFIDLFGGGYVELAVTLGVPRERINTIIDFAGAEKHGVKTEGRRRRRRARRSRASRTSSRGVRSSCPWRLSILWVRSATLIPNSHVAGPVARSCSRSTRRLPSRCGRPNGRPRPPEASAGSSNRQENQAVSGAGGGNRTRDSCLEGKGITTMQRPRRNGGQGWIRTSVALSRAKFTAWCH
jgi:NADPH2:quinone reductase